MKNLILNHRRAGYGALAIETSDESRCIAELVAGQNSSSIWYVSAAGGIVDPKRGTPIDATAGISKAFGMLTEQCDTILLISDWHQICSNAAAYRPFLNAFPAIKGAGNMVVFLAPHWQLPAELKSVIPVINDPLPTTSDFETSLTVVEDSIGSRVPDDIRDHVLSSAKGLTVGQAEDSFALSHVETGSITAELVQREKMRLVKASGRLEVFPACSVSEVGGLDALKDYLVSEVQTSWDNALLRVRGILLAGIPGTGKSLSAKLCGSVLGVPVLRMDMASLKGSLVGQSEKNLREALRLAEAISPCVLWMDELEKAVAGGTAAGKSDGGTSSGMLGILLTWLQEHTAPIFVVGTVNDYELLPSSLTRAGRFDERFYVDIPTVSEREEIATVHLQRYASECRNTVAIDIGQETENWTGAEIEQLVKSAARRNGGTVDVGAIREAKRYIKPILQTSPELVQQREEMRAKLRPANAIIREMPSRVVA